MDFVHTATGKPVNSPFKYELWSVSSTSSARPAIRIWSLERLWGHAEKDIRPGEEKFVLRDGMTYVLKRPGCKPLRFTVPTRATSSARRRDVDELDLPRVVS